MALAPPARATPLLRRFAAAAAQAALRPHAEAAPAARDPATFHARDLVVETTEQPRPKPRLQDLVFGKAFTDHMLVCEYDARLGGWAAPRIVAYPAPEAADSAAAAAAAAPAAAATGPPAAAALPTNLLLPGVSSPALQALHYGASCFEGMKAYPSPDGPRLFRPDLNALRFARSAARLGLAPWSPRELLSCLAALVAKDAGWLPDAPGHSLYLRPFAYASEPGLGVHRSSRTAVVVIASPAGPYFKTGAAPVSLFLDQRRVRAWPGGTGAFKICGNYAPTVVPQSEAAAAHGAAQVLYTMPAAALLEVAARRRRRAAPAGGPAGHLDQLAAGRSPARAHQADGEEEEEQGAGARLVLPPGLRLSDRVVGECGAMNVFFVLEEDDSKSGGALELVTPPLDDGTILPGVTRQSALELAREWAAQGGGEGGGGGNKPPPLRVSERHVTVRELREAAADGRLREIFGTGTACVVQPVSELVVEEDEEEQEGRQGSSGGGGGVTRLVAPGSSSSAAAAAAASADASAPSAPLWARLSAALADIQYGRVPGHPWSVRVADLLDGGGKE